MKSLDENFSRVERKRADIVSTRPMRLKVRTPVDDVERDACVRHPVTCYRSGWVGESEFLCTRGEHHEGDHVAGAGAVVCLRWAQS